ncbi:MAG: GldG family protein, partial [Clostridiales bacterium]|nr:GldG family protein [Clostridiales bacterium]
MDNKSPKRGANPIAGFFKRRNMRYGGTALILTVAVVAAVILINVAFGAIEGSWNLRIDVTSMGVTRFDEQTYQIVGELDQPVYIYAVLPAGSTSASVIQVDEVLKKYASINGNVRVEYLDPVK